MTNGGRGEGVNQRNPRASVVGEVGVVPVVVPALRVARFPYRVAGEANPDDEFSRYPVELESSVHVFPYPVEEIRVHVIRTAVVLTVSEQ